MSNLSPVNAVEVIRGTSRTLALHVTDVAGDNTDLTGGRVVFTVKCKIEDEQNTIQKDSDVGPAEVEIVAAKEGRAEIKLVPADTRSLSLGKYVFDVWVVLVGGERHLVVGPSDFVVKAGVTVLGP
jgi:hypothetical protein